MHLARALVVSAVVMAVLSSCAPQPEAPVAHENSDVGIQLFQWNWDSIGQECTSTLGPAGIDWVLTSPPQEHVLGDEWWVAYQPVSYQIESRLGTREQFTAMVATCADAGVDIVADAVINHMSGRDSGVGWAGSPFSHYEYPGIYSVDDFHRCTESVTGDIGNYRNADEVRNCELVNLADLDTESESVRTTITAYLNDLIGLGVAGFRIDAAKHMLPEDIAAIVASLPPDIRIVQEVIRGGGEPITPEQYSPISRVYEFGFARDLKTMIESGTLRYGALFGPAYKTLPSDDAITFVDNHDTERNGQTLSYKDGRAYLLANAFLLTQAYGSPVLYSGFAFQGRDAGPPLAADASVLPITCSAVPSATKRLYPGEWTCLQRWPELTRLIAFHDAVGDEPVTAEWDNASHGSYAFSRGAYGFAVFNSGDDRLVESLQTELVPGEYIDAMTGRPIEVDAAGLIFVSLAPTSAIVISVADGPR